jgi:hypothetical protein
LDADQKRDWPLNCPNASNAFLIVLHKEEYGPRKVR